MTLGMDSLGVRSPDMGTQFQQPGLNLWVPYALRHLPDMLVEHDQVCVHG